MCVCVLGSVRVGRVGQGLFVCWAVCVCVCVCVGQCMCVFVCVGQCVCVCWAVYLCVLGSVYVSVGQLGAGVCWAVGVLSRRGVASVCG